VSAVTLPPGIVRLRLCIAPPYGPIPVSRPLVSSSRRARCHPPSHCRGLIDHSMRKRRVQYASV
jgi:hypothetical protein